MTSPPREDDGRDRQGAAGDDALIDSEAAEEFFKGKRAASKPDPQIQISEGPEIQHDRTPTEEFFGESLSAREGEGPDE